LITTREEVDKENEAITCRLGVLTAEREGL
jgi:hypothetical protein